jgi:hypothetical protein
MPDSGSAGVRASFEPRHGETRQAGTSFESHTVNGRQAVREPAHRTSERYDQGATPAPSLNQAGTWYANGNGRCPGSNRRLPGRREPYESSCAVRRRSHRADDPRNLAEWSRDALALLATSLVEVASRNGITGPLMFTGHGWPARPPAPPGLGVSGRQFSPWVGACRRRIDRGCVLPLATSTGRDRLCVAVAVMAQQGSRPREWCMGLLLSPGAGLGPRGCMSRWPCTAPWWNSSATCPLTPLENYLRRRPEKRGTGAVSSRITWSGSSIRLGSPGGCRTASAPWS